MHTIAAFVKRHQVLSFYVVTFAVSWGGVLILGTPYGLPATSEDAGKVWPIVFIPYFLGPSLASIGLTGLVEGRAGLRELRARLLRWRVGIRWYAAALLTAPLLVTAVLSLLSKASAEYLPAIVTAQDKLVVVLMGSLVGLIEGGLLEELGWTGFAIHRLKQHRGIFATGLIVGGLHAVWHFLPTFWASGDPSGAFSPMLFLPPCVFYAGVLPAFRILMVWVYDRSESLLVSLLMHASLTASTLFILSPGATGIPLMMYYVILTALMWAAVALLALAGRGTLASQSPNAGRAS